MTFVWADGTIYDAALGAYRPATPEEIAEDRAEQESEAAGLRFWSHIAQGHVRTGRRSARAR